MECRYAKSVVKVAAEMSVLHKDNVDIPNSRAVMLFEACCLASFRFKIKSHEFGSGEAVERYAPS